MTASQNVPTDLPDYVETGMVLANHLDVLAAQAFIPSGSQFLFTPSVDHLIFGQQQQVVYLEPVIGTIDAEGDLYDSYGKPLELVANQGQDSATGSFSWSVVPKVGGKQRTKFNLDVYPGVNNYLADAMAGTQKPPDNGNN